MPHSDRRPTTKARSFISVLLCHSAIFQSAKFANKEEGLVADVKMTGETPEVRSDKRKQRKEREKRETERNREKKREKREKKRTKVGPLDL